MKTIQAKDVLGNSVKELIKKRNELKKELFDYMLKNSIRALKQTHLIKVAKRNIARINTALASKRVG